MKCSICDKEFSEDDPGTVMPFCSLRCKTIDAGRWLDEKYGLPYASEDIEPSEDISAFRKRNG